MNPSTLEWQRFSHHLGLSEYEERVYVSLVMGGASENQQADQLKRIDGRKLLVSCRFPEVGFKVFLPFSFSIGETRFTKIINDWHKS